MVSGGSDGPTQPRPSRRYSNPASSRPKPSRTMTSLPAQPLDEESAMEVISRPNFPRASSQPVAGLEHALQEGTTEKPVQVPNGSVERHTSPTTSAVMATDLPIAPAQDSLSERPIQLPQATADSPGQAHVSAVVGDTLQTTAGDAHQEQEERLTPTLDLDGLPADAGACQPSEAGVSSGQPAAVGQQEQPVSTDTDTVDGLLAGTSARVASIPRPLTLTTPQSLAPNVDSLDAVLQTNSLRLQVAPSVDNATSTNGFTQTLSPSPIVTTPGGAGSASAGRKRPADADLSEERRLRSRMGIDVAKSPIQLPTPQDSPVAVYAATLGGRFESALADVLSRPMTTDLEPVIDLSRIEMVREACIRNDGVFLLLHTIFCMFSAGQTGPLGQLQFTATHMQGLQLLVTILGSNRHVTIEMFQLFLGFPRSPKDLVRDHGHELSVLLEEVRCFLFHLASGFVNVRDAAIKRNCPPCPAELKFSLKLASPVLQKALFLSILRQSDNDERWNSLALSLFEREMINPAGSAISISALNAYHGSQLGPIVAQWGVMYGQQRKRYEETKSGHRMHPLNSPQLPDTFARSQAPQLALQVPPVQQNASSTTASNHGSTHQAAKSMSPSSIQQLPPMQQSSNAPNPQTQYQATTLQSRTHTPRATFYSNSPTVHSPAHLNLHPQVQQTPYWQQPPNIGPNNGQVPQGSSANMAFLQPIHSPQP